MQHLEIFDANTVEGGRKAGLVGRQQCAVSYERTEIRRNGTPCSLGRSRGSGMGSFATAQPLCITELARAGPILRSGTPYQACFDTIEYQYFAVPHCLVNSDSKEGQLICPIRVKRFNPALARIGPSQEWAPLERDTSQVLSWVSNLRMAGKDTPGLRHVEAVTGLLVSSSGKGQLMRLIYGLFPPMYLPI